MWCVMFNAPLPATCHPIVMYADNCPALQTTSSSSFSPSSSSSSSSSFLLLKTFYAVVCCYWLCKCETQQCCCCVSGSDDDRKQKSNAMVSAGWPLTGFAVFILPVTKASETQQMDRHLPEPANNPPPSAFASPRPPANSPRLPMDYTTSCAGVSALAGSSSPSSAVSSVPSATDLHASPSSLDLVDNNPNLWASHPQQQLMSTVVHIKKRKRSEEDSPEEQQQQWHQQQERHVTKAAVNLLSAGQIGEVVVTGVGLAADYYRSAYLQG